MAGSTGYRAWVATEDGRLVSLYGFGHWPTRGWYTAECRMDRHGTGAPVEDCTCGISVVLDLDEMRGLTRRMSGLPWVIAAVDYKGPTCRGAYINGGEFTDPPSTVRVRHARLRKVVVLSPEAAPLRGVLGRTLGTDVVAGAAVDSAVEAAPTDLHDLLALAGQVAGRAMDRRRVREDPARASKELRQAGALLDRVKAALNADRRGELPGLRDELLACLR